MLQVADDCPQVRVVRGVIVTHLLKVLEPTAVDLRRQAERWSLLGNRRSAEREAQEARRRRDALKLAKRRARLKIAPINQT